MTLARTGAGYRQGVERPTIWERLRRVDPLMWDSLLAASVLAVTMIAAAGARHAPDAPHGLDALGYALIVLGCLPLVVRRRWPLPTLVVVLVVAGLLSAAAGGFDLVLAVALASYSAAAHTPRERFARSVVPVATVGAIASQLLGYRTSNWVEVAIAATFSAELPMLAGRIAFNRRRRIATDRERAAHDAVAEERARIARELHDIVAHAMSVMVVQAGAARTVVDRDPAAAKAAIGRIEATGRDGLAEMRRLIGILKDEAAAADRAPQPGLEQLEALLETVRGAGVTVEAVTEGTPRPLAPGLDLIAYRIVQEALTNVIKHAGPASARVLMDWSDAALDVEVADDGRGAMPSSTGDGHGLLGMRERVALVRRFARDPSPPRWWVRGAGPPSHRGWRPAGDRHADDPRADRRRSGADARRLPHDPRRRGRPRGRRRGDRRRRRGARFRAVASRRRRDGRAHADDGRHRGHATHHGARCGPPRC